MIPGMKTLICSILAAALVAVADADELPHVGNLVDHRIAPAAAEDWSTIPFCDQGAWFGFGLAPRAAGGFTGPFLMTTGRWLSPGIVRLETMDADSVETVGRPGLLRQRRHAGSVEITEELWFPDQQVALVSVRLRNGGPAAVTLSPAWSGSVFADQGRVERRTDGVLVQAVSGDVVSVRWPDAVTVTMTDAHHYRAELATPVTLNPGQEQRLSLAVTMAVAGAAETDPAPWLADVAAQRRANRLRWQGYAEAVARCGPADGQRGRLAMTCVQTLVGNWRGPAGRFEHGGLWPSSNVWYFNGFWAWDSWKHAVALARFAPGVAADQLRLMAAQQDEHGMIADVVYLDASEDNWRNTKPPLLGWALEAVFNATGDTALVRDLYPRAVAFHEFWYQHRDHDGDGLCEYGSTDGTVVAARWDSGMDNAVRFDATEMVQNGPGAWSMDQESVDLNSYLVRDKRALSALSAVAGVDHEAAHWATEAEQLAAHIRQTMFNPATGWFHDIDLKTGEFIAAQGPEGWTPLWAGVASERQAARVRQGMVDPERFATPVPFPTVSRRDPEFSEGYWRGLVWLDQVGFALESLRRYGYHDDARRLTAQLLENLEGAGEPGRPLRENYHPLTGEGRNVRHFSWTAAHLLLLMMDD